MRMQADIQSINAKIETLEKLCGEGNLDAALILINDLDKELRSALSDTQVSPDSYLSTPLLRAYNTLVSITSKLQEEQQKVGSKLGGMVRNKKKVNAYKNT